MFSGTDNQTITLAQGSSNTANFRAAHPTAIKGEYFGLALLNAITSQTGCTGIRVYNGLDSAGNQANVLVGVDINGNDLVNGVLGDRSVKSPPYGGNSNSLNS